MKKKILTVLPLLSVMATVIFAQQLPQLGKNSNQEVISAMKMEDKARLLVGLGMKMPEIPPSSSNTPPLTATPPAVQGTVVGTTEDRVPGAAGTTAPFAQWNIPKIVVADGPAGLRIAPRRPDDSRSYYATAFPIATLLASTWNTELVNQVGAAMGNEVKEYGVDILLGPGMNIQRSALGGRNFEYYSEDPLISGKMAAAMVKGIQSNGVGTSIKHFAANNFETNRNTVNVKVSERALREIYLRGFEIAVKESNPWTVMTSYNKINGTYTSENADLLKKILRQDWAYKGFVMSDWFGGTNAVEQMKAGNNLLMPGTPEQLNTIIRAVKEGKLAEKYLNENVDEMLTLLTKTSSFKGFTPSNRPDLAAHAEVARQAAAEGIILLKNDNSTLPLKSGWQITAFGNYSYDLVAGGTGSGDVNEAYIISLPEGLRNAGFDLNKPIKTAYDIYLKAEKEKLPKHRSFFEPPVIIPELVVGNADIAASADADVAIITIGRISGEFDDRKLQNDYNLTATEQDMIGGVSKAFHAKGKKVVVILNIGGVIETASWRDKVDAILLAWLPGQEAGNAIADILSGKITPSGKLAVSFLKRYEDDPISADFPGKEYGAPFKMDVREVRQMESDYKEGIYVGYRAFDKQNITPAYPFGFGMSYTTFTYSDLQLSSAVFKDNITASVTVKNTGRVAGKEAVQLYLAAPGKTLDKPVQELKGFAKTRTLQPGESQTLTMTLNVRSLTSFDEKSSSWVAEKGTYTVKIGASSRDIRLKSDFMVKKKLRVEKVNRALPLQR